jgi:hypothetical protein
LEHGKDYEWLDVRPLLMKDPGSVVDHFKDGAFPETQALVMGQDGYPQAIEAVFDIIQKEVKVCFIYCGKGIHRANVVGRHAEDLANALRRQDGTPIFAANFFRLLDVKRDDKRDDKREHVKQVMTNVALWIDNPWMDRGQIEVQIPYGTAAAKSDFKAFYNWDTAMRIMSTWPPTRLTTDAVAQAADDEDDGVGDQPSSWKALLLERNVDASATIDLLELANMSDKGRLAAKALVRKLAAKTDLRNSSAFIAKSTANARIKLGEH